MQILFQWARSTGHNATQSRPLWETVKYKTMWAFREADAFHILIFLACPDWRIKKKKKGDTRSCSGCTQTYLGLPRSATRVMMHAKQNVRAATKQLRSPSTGASNATHLKLQKIPQLTLSDLTCAKWLPIVPQRQVTSLGRGHRLRTIQKVSLLERCKRFFWCPGTAWEASSAEF